MARQRLPIIRASEMGEWREYGVALHHRHGRAVAGSRVLLVLGGLLAIAAMVLLLLGR